MPQCISNTFKRGRIGLAEVQPVPDTPRYTRASVQSSKLQLQPERLTMLFPFLHPAAIYFSTCGHLRGKMSWGDGCWRRRILLLVLQHLDFGERRWVFDFIFFSAPNKARWLLETTEMNECTATPRPGGLREPGKVPRMFSKEKKKVKVEESAS